MPLFCVRTIGRIGARTLENTDAVNCHDTDNTDAERQTMGIQWQDDLNRIGPTTANKAYWAENVVGGPNDKVPLFDITSLGDNTCAGTCELLPAASAAIHLTRRNATQ